MSQPNSHTHCQVAQANAPTKTWQRVCLFQRSPDRLSLLKLKGQHPTSGIKHWGVIGYSSVLPRVKFIVTRQDSITQSPTFHTAER